MAAVSEATDKFNAMMADKAGVTMPLDIDPNVNSVVDAGGRVVALIDPFGDLSDAEQRALAMLIITAVNTCGSFRATMEPTL